MDVCCHEDGFCVLTITMSHRLYVASFSRY